VAEFVFTWKSQGIERRRRSFAPKAAADPWAWFKLGCKLIPECPNPKKTDWVIKSEDVTLYYLQFELHQRGTNEIAHLTIDRRVPGM